MVSQAHQLSRPGLSLTPLAGRILSDQLPVALTVPGMLSQRRAAFQKFGGWSEPDVIVDTQRLVLDGWTEDGVVPHFTERLSKLSVPLITKDRLVSWFPPSDDVWELLWALVAVDEFVIDDPLRAMVDQKFYLVHDVYRFLWEVRFVSHETSLKDAKKLMGTFLRWLEDDLTSGDLEVLGKLRIERRIQEQERADVLCFLTTLAAQNAIVSRIVLGFEGLNDILEPKERPKLKQLHSFLKTLTRWGGLGCPVRLLIGFDFGEISRLHNLHPKLADDIQAGSVWFDA